MTGQAATGKQQQMIKVQSQIKHDVASRKTKIQSIKTKEIIN
jgi:hypothetical protein